MNDKEKAILFSTPMVQALLAGRKTMTRRIVKPQPRDNSFFMDMNYGTKRHKVGDILEPCVYVQGFNSMYCASYNGNIYSKTSGEWKVLKAFSGHKGYLNVTLMDGKRKTTRNVHTLVCSAFHGIKKPNMQVRHLDGNPSNNCAENLKWGTQAENWQDRKAHGNGIEGEKHRGSNFTDIERSHIVWAIEKGLCSQHHAARILGVPQQNIWQMCHPERLIKPSIFMPREACRLFLKVTDVRAERLQDITEQDAIAEGISLHKYGYRDYLDWDSHHTDPKESFRSLWISINGKDSWDQNPWVWVYQFEKL